MSTDIHKWTDGRYTLMFDEHTFFVWDNEKEERMTALNVTKKLNMQQATIENYRKSRDKWRTKCHQTEEKLDYWKHKSLELYKLLRKINLSDREWEEFLNIIK